jgi:hypothetical protein
MKTATKRGCFHNKQRMPAVHANNAFSNIISLWLKKSKNFLTFFNLSINLTVINNVWMDDIHLHNLIFQYPPLSYECPF